MASDYERPKGSGVLFPAKERKTDRHPHYTGEYTDLDGTVYWLSGWRNTAKSGQKYIAIKVGDEKEELPPKDYPAEEGVDDDIPF